MFSYRLCRPLGSTYEFQHVAYFSAFNERSVVVCLPPSLKQAVPYSVRDQTVRWPFPPCAWETRVEPRAIALQIADCPSSPLWRRSRTSPGAGAPRTSVCATCASRASCRRKKSARGLKLPRSAQLLPFLLVRSSKAEERNSNARAEARLTKAKDLHAGTSAQRRGRRSGR